MLATAVLFTALADSGPVTASNVCVYNAAAFVLKWHLSDSTTAAASSETKSYPVGQVKCLPLGDLANVSSGDSVYPVVKAVWGKENQASAPVLYDTHNATQITYVCKGTTLDFHCEQGKMPPTAANVTKAVGEFMVGFVEGIGSDIGFTDCLNDINKTFQDIVTIVEFFEDGFHGVSPGAIAKAFELIGDMLKDVGAAITVCVKDAENLAKQIKDLAAALSGNPIAIIKVIAEDAIHVWRERTEISTECKTTSADWRAGDYQGSGRAVGHIVGIILGGN